MADSDYNPSGQRNAIGRVRRSARKIDTQLITHRVQVNYIMYDLNKLMYDLIRLLGSRVVSVLDSGAEGPGFKSQPRRCRVTLQS